MGSTSAGFSGQGVNVFDLQKIDIIKGPASVKYGPGAIGGIINMVSKQPFLEAGLNGRFISTYGTNNNEYSVQGRLNYSNQKHSLGIGGRYMKAKDFHFANGIKAENSEHTDKDISANYSLRANSKLTFITEGNIHLGGPWGRARG